MPAAFTLGKYLPFHKGHEALMKFALERFDTLYVIVCQSTRENIPASTRAAWIKESFLGESLEVIEYVYDEDKLPNTSESSREVSRVWVQELESLVPDIQYLITSEPYGDFVAEYMGIEHVLFDQERKKTPISATQIRKNLWDNWEFLPDSVKAYFQQKITFLGTESTGKSSLSKALHHQFPSALVEEAGRELIPNSNFFTDDRLKLVAQVHADRIQEACSSLKPLVLIDTDVHITQSYAKDRFGSYLDLDESIYSRNKAHHYFYLTKDLQFFQDGTRLDEEHRNLVDISHRDTLREFNIPYIEVSGDWENRLNTIACHLKTLSSSLC